MKNKFYVTTPIYYPTANPHLGSLYSTVLADVANRWNHIQGKKTFFLTGTDEHGQKIAQAAEQKGLMPKQFVDSFIDSYKSVWKDYQIEYNRFIRTTDEDHKKAVQFWLSELIKRGDVYKDSYTGFYCVPCETFVTDKDLDQKDPKCPSCLREVKEVEEECYFFRLSKYQDKLLNFYKNNPNFVTPKERLKEVIKFVESGLKDISISRTTVKWGIPFPGDEKHVTYVWADALNNYITGIGYPSNKKEFDFWWPADLQILGKDIFRFHAIYWPAFLMASGFELPKKLLVHGWIKVDDQKMSKSLGNVVDPKDLLKNFGADQVRYYLVSQLSITQDSNFSIMDLKDKINADLVNNLGNLLNRSLQLCKKNDLNFIEFSASINSESQKLFEEFKLAQDKYKQLMNEYNFHQACSTLVSYLSRVNAYFHESQPWKLKDEKDKFLEVMAVVLNSLTSVAILLWPIMPQKMELLLSTIGIKFDFKLFDEVLGWNKNFKLIVGDVLFKKIEIEEAKEELKKETENKENYIGIEDFIKVDLRVGTIVECEEIEGSDKLLKMQVDFGQLGVRQVLGGIKKFFSTVDLINKQGVFVVNLKPRKMMGLESHGMMLTVQNSEGKLERVIPGGNVPAGTVLK